MLRILVLVLCGVFHAHGRPGVGSLQRFQRPNGPSPVIIGGSNAVTGEYPYVLSLQYNSATAGWGHFCGGTLLKSRYVLTTAHCIENKPVENMRAVAGTAYLEDGSGEAVLIADYITHPDYDISTGLPNDIAVMTLAGTVTIGTAGNGVLPPDDGNLYVQTNCVLVGWGYTTPEGSTVSPVLKKLTTPVISNSECATDLSAYDNAAVFDTHICTKSVELDSGPCDADTGSPLKCCASETDCSASYVVGVTSYVMVISGACQTRDPAVHVRTNKFLAWIEANTP